LNACLRVSLDGIQSVAFPGGNAAIDANWAIAV
jgi:hypothetical protein